MLEPINALDILPLRASHMSLLWYTDRMRKLTRALCVEDRTPRAIFETALRALGEEAPTVDDRTFTVGPAIWYRLPSQLCTIVLNPRRPTAYCEAIFLLAHHVMELSMPTACHLCCPFDDACWQEAPHYERHRVIYLSLMMRRLDASFRGMY